MAEFKLGRIKFVWKGNWANATTYYVDDVVRYGGRTYICVVGHSSAADFNTDLEYVPSKWNQMSDGTDWKGDWTAGTFYKLNDVVKYGGLLYTCNDSHTSAATETLGLENDQSKWTLFAEGFDWKEDWTAVTRYKKNDLVRYGGYTYVCNEGHTSAATAALGLENDQSKWDTFNPGIEYKGAWTTATRYKLNDVVKYGAGLWICTTQHTASALFGTDVANWSQFVEGFEYENTWNAGITYQPGDIVSYGGNQYVAKSIHANQIPSTETAYWDLFSEGISFQSDWAYTTSYKIGQVVRRNGYTYIATADSPSVVMTITASSSSTNEFTAGTTAGLVAGMSVRFTGTTFGGVFTGARYYVKQVVSGTKFTISETVGGSVFALTTAAGSMTATASAEPQNTAYWSVLTTGIYWRNEWIDDTEYHIGDAVRYGTNVYICINPHRSEGDDGSTIGVAGGGAANSRPDLDTTGSYWNVLAIGTETSVLTTRGDLVYYGGAGPTRLPVGLEGQVLVSNGTDPEWRSLGKVEHVFYVAPNGVDGTYPTHGATLDKPWKTIRYACQQIEKGARNPNAQYLLEMNRAFIQREVTEWIDYQIEYYTNTVPTPSSIWYEFDYDEHKCERDTGFIVDRVIWDIGHGGNLKTLSAALTYINALNGEAGTYSTADDENGTGTYSKLSTEGDNDVAAFNYMLTVVEAVLNNEAPTTVYQVENGDNSSAVVEQFINVDYVAETGVMSEITSLVNIVTRALADGNANNLPERYVPNNTVFIKSGRYRETLPIIVPAETALVGDEVRSVNAGPIGSIIDIEDAKYTVASYDRLESILSDIVTGSLVTESTGNVETQSAEWPLSTSDVADALAQKVRAMKYNTDFRLNTIHSFSYPEPTDYNTAYLGGYGDARTLVFENKEFFKQQIKAWINENYPTLKYSRTACMRDVGYIVDALVYDLTYGGNAMSVQAGLAYYEGVGSSLYIDSTEKAATLAAYAYLKDMVQDAAVNTTITSLQTVAAQYKDVALDGTNAVSFLGSNLDEMIDIVNNGPSAATLSDPSDSWVDSTYTTDYATMDSAVATIQTDTIDYINSNFGSFTYNSAYCRRDLGYLVDAAYYDAAFGSNFWAVQNGISYYRRQASTVTAAQLSQEVGTVEYLATLVDTALEADATAQSRAAAAYTEIVDILENGVGAANSLVYTDTGTANFTNARAQLVTNRAFIISEVSTWLSTNYAAAWADMGAAGQATCQRDIGYTIDALAYDVNYGGNLATRNVARSLFNNITGVSVYPNSTQKTAAAALYTYLGTVCSDIVQELYAGQDTSGTAASGTEGARMVTLCGNIEDVITADSLSGLVAESAPSITWVDNGIEGAVGDLATDKTTIIAAALQYITDTYSSFSYNHAKCSRDVATIIKAVGYDMMFNSNFQSLKSAYAYLRATASEVFTLNQKTVTRSALTFVRNELLDLSLDSVTEARITALFRAIDDIIYSGSNEGAVCQSEDRTVDWAILQLERNRQFIVAEMTAWMNYNYVNFDNYYDSDTCNRDIGLIVDAVISDLATGSNFASSVAGMSYYRIQSALVTDAQMMQTVAAVKEAKRLTAAYVTDSSLYSAVNAAFDNVVAILEGGLSAVPTYTWPDNGTSDATSVADAAALQTNRATMITGVETYLSTTAPYDTVWAALTTDQKNTCKRDVGYIIDAITYDVQYGGDYQSTVAGSAYYSFGTLQIAGGEKAASIAAVTELGTLMKAYTSGTGDTAVDTLTDLIEGIINTGTIPAYTLPSVSGESAAKQATHAAILADKETVQDDVTEYITDTFSSYTYNTALCERDVNEMIDALKWDLRYSSNYKSMLCVRWYANAVAGSYEEDMFYLRNGTGVRNMTLEGLSGDLTPPNQYGTSRVTAGAYASLDPGWGPDDFRTWIIHRSPYVQNCCTFGYAAIGQKIDGALHNGGYDSIVSNDFTQLISDGIGAWVTNNGRAELVSVFTYYSHIGYLSEAGGRIRGTNGNNSYGDFGSVAEGYDTTEIPGMGVVDNRNFKATVGSVFTDGADDILAFEFDNAGSEYTEATWVVTGAGSGANVEQDEFRDDAVFEVRLLDNVDDSTSAPEADGNFGGFGYISNSNTAQGGTTTQITIAATDSEISTAYVGMKIYLDGGTGAGQFGIIATYNSGTKVATIVKETTGGAGWDHVIPGSTISAPDASTTYTIEPRISFTSPSFTSTAATLPTSGDWAAVKYGDTSGVYTAISGTSSANGSGSTWQIIRNGSKYSVSNVTAGTDYVRLETITILGSDVGGDDTTNDITITVTSVDTNGAIQAFEYTGYGIGGLYVAVRSGSVVGATSDDGSTWTTRTGLMPSGAAWSAIAHGMLDDGSSVGKVSMFVAVSTGGTAAAYSTDGITWTAATLPTSANWVDVTFGEGRFVAIASDSQVVAISNDGIFWDVEGEITATGFTSIAYGMGLFVAITSGSTASAYSTDGISWTAGGSLPASTNWSSITWGNGRFVAVSSSSGTNAAYSLNGDTWAASTLPATASWTAVTYGQGLFLAVTDSTQAATSENGVIWTSRTMSTAASGFSAATFGNTNRYGLFVAVGGGTGTVASYVRAGATARARAYVSQNKIYAIRLLEPGSGYASAPTMTITDPNNVYEAPFAVRTGKGALATPSFKNRGTGYVSADAEVDTGDGYGDYFQSGQYISVKRLTKFPLAGSNVVFGHLPNETFKLVNVLTQLGTNEGDYRAFFQIAPPMKAYSAPSHEASVTTRIRYSQVRLTGHDFLDVGTGSFDDTNYPTNLPDNSPSQANETVNNNGGRVFYTSTDQDGNFRVGELFTIEQSTGVATLNADAFNIAGLQELTLGEVSLGGGSASITEFSTDPFFTANSDSIVPTQRAIKAYIASQIGGGGASLNVNSVTAGYIYIAGQQITTTTGGVIQMNANFEFRGGVTGLPVAWNYFLNN